jgi:hypothetical protein
MRALVGSLMLSLVACGGARGTDSGATPPSSASASDCPSTAAVIARVLAAETEPKQASSVQTAVAQRCADDGWTAEARSCLSAATSSEALGDCGYNHLTQAQGDKLKQATASLGSATARRALKAMEEFRDRLCACKDAACAEEVSSDMTKWSQEMSRTEKSPPALSDAEAERAGAIGDKMGECLQNVLASSPPPVLLRVTGMEPDRGEPRGGTKVTIAGTGFTTEESRKATVYFGDKQAKNVRFASDTELVVDAPAGKANQTVDVRVVFDPGGETVLPDAFTYGKKKK